MKANPAKAREHLANALKSLQDRSKEPAYAIGAAMAHIKFAQAALGDASVNLDPRTWGPTPQPSGDERG